MALRSLSAETAAPKPRPKRAVIFDLDQILIDSQSIDLLRQARRWGEVYSSIPRLPPYPGVEGLLRFLASRGVSIGLATARPRRYCELVVKRWRWPVHAMATFEDKKARKPSPESLFLCLERLGAPAEKSAAVCLDAQDVEAAKAAGLYSIAAMWAPPPANGAAAAEPNARCFTVTELEQLLKRFFDLMPPSGRKPPR